MKGRALFLEVHFNDLLGVIPGTTCICHEYGLVESEECYSHKVADEEVGVKERERQCHEKDNDEDVQHTLLSILGADLHDFFAILDGRLFFVKIDVFLDEDHGPVGACCNGLGCCTCEPVDDCATHKETE